MNDNSSSSDILRQDSVIEATEVKTLPALFNTKASSPPTEADLGSHLNEEASWRDAAEVILSAADVIAIPVLGAAIKEVVSAGVGLGKYSPNERLKNKQFNWVINEIGKISHRIDILLNKLPSDEQIEAADVAAIINSAMKASEKTADAKKRQLLKNAVVNSFDIEQYQQGLTLRLFKILEEVEYGDVQILSVVKEINVEGIGYSEKYEIKSLLKNLQNENSSGIGNIFYHHLEILEKQNLVVIWNRLSNQPLGIASQGNVQITDLGKKFLEFVKETQ